LPLANRPIHFIYGKKMTKKLILLATAACLLQLNLLFGQQTKIYLLRDVWQKTLQSYPSLVAKNARIEEQQLRKDLVKKQFLPGVVVQSQQSYGSVQNMPGSFFPLPGTYTAGSNASKSLFTNGGSATSYSSAVLQWNFLQFGRERKRLHAANTAIAVSIGNLKQEEWELLSDVTQLYFNTLEIMALLEIARSDSRRLAELFNLLQSQVDAGLHPGADTLLLKSSLLSSIAKEHDYQSVLKAKLEQMAALIGEPGADFLPDTSTYYRFKETAVEAGDALQHHPYLQVLNARVGNAEAGKEVVKSEWYPTVGLLAGAGVKGSGIQADGTISNSVLAPWSNATANYLVGIGLTWNFSSLYENKNKQAIADRLISSATADRDAAQLQLTAGYAAALAGWDERRQGLEASRASLDAARGAYALYEVRYQSGLINLIELLQLQKNLQDAEGGYINAINAYWNQQVNQAASLGDPTLILTAIEP
jgi:outer membrane protein